jgi:uncharacterized damage-inducible protein DinB
VAAAETDPTDLDRDFLGLLPAKMPTLLANISKLIASGENRIVMNYYGAKELADGFRTVRKNTLLIAKEIPEAQYGYRAAPDTRSVGELLAHIINAPSLQEQIHGTERRTTLEGFDFPSLMTQFLAKEKEPRNKAQVIESLRQDGDRFAAWLDTLTDDFLAERVSMMPGMTPASKTRFEMILGVKEHEMHHRGQLMLIERMLGIVPHLTREMQARIAAFTQAKVTA